MHMRRGSPQLTDGLKRPRSRCDRPTEGCREEKRGPRRPWTPQYLHVEQKRHRGEAAGVAGGRGEDVTWRSQGKRPFQEKGVQPCCVPSGTGDPV